MSAIVRTYFAAKGSHLTDADAKIIGEFVDDECGGQITAAEFVEKAEAGSSPLHPYLEWDDSVAAHEHRLTQARYALRSVVIYDDKAPGEKVRAFQKVTLADSVVTEAYVSHEIIWRNPDLIEQVVTQAYRELRAFVTKYRTYKELAELVGVVEEVIDR